MTKHDPLANKIGLFLQRWGWLLPLLLAASLRFWQLGVWPPGLYRDEAFNGLDALTGEYPIFYTANNGREPSYIYLTAVSIALFGRSVLALRLPAALIGTLTTIPVYYLGKQWFGRQTGWLAATLWAITLWPIHLSHIGLRLILLPLCLALTFWLATLAYHRRQPWLWLAAGFVYGLGFYTYLAIRFTPVLLLAILFYLVWQRRWRALWPGLAYFALATAVALLPLLIFYLQNPDLLVGRTGQVSILSHSINQGDLWGTLLRHIGRSVGLFVWQGDTIIRHNPAGRPLFDLLMALPFVVGVGVCLHRWRQPAAAIILIWISCMLAVTVLAEDAPHFLRSVGILPAVLFLPALALAMLWQWGTLPRLLRQGTVLLLLALSLWSTMRDYAAYGRDPETALMFEAAATELAAQLKAESAQTAVYLDRWFWDESSQKGWPSIPFLADLSRVTLYRPEWGVPPAAIGQQVSIYAWPYGDIDFVPTVIQPPALVSVQSGSLSRGDLETTAYPLYSRYHAQPLPPEWPLQLNFSDQLTLVQASATAVLPTMLDITLFWAGQTAVSPHLRVFVQVVSAEGVLSQQDVPPGLGLWQADWWQQAVVVQETHTINLPRPFDPAQHHLIVGLYDSQTGQRLPILGENGQPTGDHWQIPVQ